eukprot:gene4885-3504_t
MSVRQWEITYSCTPPPEKWSRRLWNARYTHVQDQMPKERDGKSSSIYSKGTMERIHSTPVWHTTKRSLHHRHQTITQQRKRQGSGKGSGKVHQPIHCLRLFQ